MTTLALFSNKGGVGTTTLAYHLAHTFSRLGQSVLAVDLDPQATLTAHFLDDEELERLWGAPESASLTVAGALQPYAEGLEDVVLVAPRQIADNLHLLPGDLTLGRFEERLALEWPATLAGDNNATRVTTAFHRIVGSAAEQVGAALVLVDLGPNLDAVNRSALLIADHVLVPLAADVVSAQGLRNLGPTLRRWRTDWQDTALLRMSPTVDAPRGEMRPLGYVLMQPSVRLNRQVAAYQAWQERIPHVYADAVLGSSNTDGRTHEIGTIRPYRSLMPLAHDARKPMFDLRPADGAIGSTQRYVQICLQEFRHLAREIMRRLNIPEPPD